MTPEGSDLADLLLGDGGGARDRLRIDVDPEELERGLAQLVLTVVELLRELMERQALRRAEGGSLPADEVDRLGEAFLRLDQRMDDLCEVFGISRDDLNLHLGPLGPLR